MHNTGCLKESKQSMVTREAGKPVNIVTLEPDRLDVCGPNWKPQRLAYLISTYIFVELLRHGRQRYRDGVCSLLFLLFFIIPHPYIPRDAFVNCIIHNVWQVLGHSKRCKTCHSHPPFKGFSFHFTSHVTHTFPFYFLSSKRIQTPNVTILDNHVLITIQVVWHTSLQSLTK